MPSVTFRKFFKLRYKQIGEDFVNINEYVTIQLKKRVQSDGINCGILCLKV